MKNRAETRVSLRWILEQKEPFYGAQLARAVNMHQVSACRQLRNLERNCIIKRVENVDVRIVLYDVSDIAACQKMADYKPKPLNGYTPVAQRRVKRIINSVWSLGE